MNPIHPNRDKEEHRAQGIPFARPGDATDYAQTIISIMVVSLSLFQGVLSAADILT